MSFYHAAFSTDKNKRNQTRVIKLSNYFVSKRPVKILCTEYHWSSAPLYSKIWWHYDTLNDRLKKQTTCCSRSVDHNGVIICAHFWTCIETNRYVHIHVTIIIIITRIITINSNDLPLEVNDIIIIIFFEVPFLTCSALY